MTKILHVGPTRAANKMQGVNLSQQQLEAVASNPAAMRRIGVGMDGAFIKKSLSAAMDAGIQSGITTVSAGTPVQFLQEFLSGVVHVLTTARRGDTLAPIITAGNWHDEEVVQAIVEHLGTPELYDDHGGIPLASWNQTFEKRTIVRFAIGLQVQKLEESRAGEAGVNSASEKRAAVAAALEILRNEVFFYGYYDGTAGTYGFLNDPNLPAYVTVDTGEAGDTTWATKTVAERVSDLVSAIAALRVQSGSNVDPESMALTLAVASSVKDYMNESDESFSNGMTVNEWLTKNYPNITTKSIPELDGADSDENVFYLYADKVADSGTDDSSTICQLVPTKMQALNSVPTMKGYEEGYTNATAGCYVKRGFAVVRRSGI